MINTSLLTVPNILIIGLFTIAALLVLGFVGKITGISIG